MLNSFLIIIKNNNRVKKIKKPVDFEPLTVQISTVFSYVKRDRKNAKLIGRAIK